MAEQSSGSKKPTKTVMGIPDPIFPRGVVLTAEAGKSRRRLYPVTVFYTAIAALVLFAGVRSGHAAATFAYAAAGLVVWTYVEYLIHRYVLHGIFPPSSGWFRGFLHRRFDNLHWEHHQRPWDGNHINGVLRDTVPFTAPALLLSLLAPVYTWPAFLAGFLQGYVIEEWVHHSTHFYAFGNRFFRHLKARHLYHHSRVGADIIFGLSNGFWDVVFDTAAPPLHGPAIAGPGAGARRRGRGASTGPSDHRPAS